MAIAQTVTAITQTDTIKEQTAIAITQTVLQLPCCLRRWCAVTVVPCSVVALVSPVVKIKRRQASGCEKHY